MHVQTRTESDAVRREQVLARQLTSLQQTMMALGGAIGTGLFLASGLAVNVAGPAIILSYVFVAAVSLLLGRALSEMAVANPTAGSFGVYAGMFVSPFAGYAVRVSYWLMEVIATGGQLVAASIYMRPYTGFCRVLTCPDDTSIKSAPAALNARAMAMASTSVLPPSTQSCAEIRTDIGSCTGHTWRIASNTSSGHRRRFSTVPPYSSVRWFVSGDRNEENRYPCAQ